MAGRALLVLWDSVAVRRHFDHDTKESAAARIIRLNGGSSTPSTSESSCPPPWPASNDEVQSLVASIVMQERKDSVVDSVKQGIGLCVRIVEIYIGQLLEGPAGEPH